MIVDWLTKNWVLKVVSLILAFGLWYYALGEEGIEVKRTLPLEIRVENSQISLLKSSAKHIKVTLSAPRSLLSQMTSGEMTAAHVIGNEAKSAGDYSFRLQPREIQLPTPQIRIVKIEPEVIEVTLDELIVQKLAVKPNFVGEPSFGYTMSEEEIQMDPDAILIEGPRGKIEKLDAVKTEALDLVGRIRSFRRTVSLDLPPNVKPLSEAVVDIYVPIKEEFNEKSFEEVDVKVIRSTDAKEKITVEPEKISFVLKGSVRQLEKLSPEKIVAYLDLSEYDDGEYVVPVQLVLPEDVTLSGDEPVEVAVTIKKR